MKSQKGYAVALLLVYVTLLVAGVGGWVANVVKLIGMNFDHITGMLVVRAIGVVVAPLGAVLGFC